MVQVIGPLSSSSLKCSLGLACMLIRSAITKQHTRHQQVQLLFILSMAGTLKHEMGIELLKKAPQRMTEALEVSSPPDSGASTRIAMMGNGELRLHQVTFGRRLSDLQ